MYSSLGSVFWGIVQNSSFYYFCYAYITKYNIIYIYKYFNFNFVYIFKRSKTQKGKWGGGIVNGK